MRGTHGRADYNVDLLSPAALTLLRRAAVIDPSATEADDDVSIVDWEFAELPVQPGRPVARLR